MAVVRRVDLVICGEQLATSRERPTVHTVICFTSRSVYLMISVYNESIIRDCNGAEIFRLQLFVVVCELVMHGTTVLPWNRGTFFHGTSTVEITVLPWYRNTINTAVLQWSFRKLTTMGTLKLSAEGAKYEGPKALSVVGSGERRKLPQRGPPRQLTRFAIF